MLGTALTDDRAELLVHIVTKKYFDDIKAKNAMSPINNDIVNLVTLESSDLDVITSQNSNQAAEVKSKSVMLQNAGILVKTI